jgi:hypothetical protein
MLEEQLSLPHGVHEPMLDDFTMRTISCAVQFCHAWHDAREEAPDA